MKKRPWQEVGLINLMRYLDLKLTLAGDILVKVDRASMAVSLEVRPLYLQRDLVSLAQRIPPDLLADRNNSKKVLKSALENWLPNSVLYRKKMGFALPLKRWIGGKLNNLFLDDNDQTPLEELLDMTMLRDMTSSHLSGNADWTSVIHSLFYLKRWFKTWMGPSPPIHVD
jgi:asparagine synthase (glutamine-hydrolysing)